jgi:pimeloyl-ACP methyl ester carboxylesterase
MISSHVTIQLHGFTGSGKVFKRNVAGLSQSYYVLVPDLRGHGDSDKPRSGYHVSRLAIDLANFIEHMRLSEYGNGKQIAAIGTSLGAAILWYAPSFISASDCERTFDNSS